MTSLEAPSNAVIAMHNPAFVCARALSRITSFRFVLLFVILALPTGLRAKEPTQQKIGDEDRERVEHMLRNIRDALKTSYYDPSFHGIDIDARYKRYDEQIKKAETVGGALRVVAAYLSGLNDSHTVFIPPDRNNIADYGFEMQMVGDACFVTQVRPGSDAEQKIHPGDQILSLDGYAVSRVDFSQLQYYLRRISPKPLTGMTVRSPSEETRNVMIATKFIEHRPLSSLDFEVWRERADVEKTLHPLRQRYVERGDVLFWKMPTFLAEESEIDRVVDIARQHKTLVLDLRGTGGGSSALVESVAGGVRANDQMVNLERQHKTVVQDLQGNGGGANIIMEHMVGSVMDHEVTVATRVRRGGSKPETAKSRGKNAFTGKLIVLLDSDSASWSEVLARVVQLEHRGTVIGDRSAGSVMDASLIPFRDYPGTVLYGALITTADLIMVDGKRLEKVGVTPDVLVLPTAAQLAEGQDPVLAKAAELAGTKLDPAEAGKLFPFEWGPQ